GDILEMFFAVAPIKRTDGITAGLAEVFNGGTTHQQNVEITVVVVIQEGGATAHHFEDVSLHDGIAALNITKTVETRLRRHVNECRRGRAHGCIPRNQPCGKRGATGDCSNASPDRLLLRPHSMCFRSTSWSRAL